MKPFEIHRLFGVCALSLLAGSPLFAQADLDQRIAKQMDSLVATYKHFHEHPELSKEEKETSAILVNELRPLGYEVTDHFGQYDAPGGNAYGVVAVLRNGPGPTVMVRTDMDALPIEEKTGLPYASHVKVKRPDGTEVSVMHACGHDIHMTVLIGTARTLSQMKQSWGGTLILIGQPAEEVIAGASAMLHAGLFTKFPKPDYVLALHDTNNIPAGKVGWREGTLLAGADSVDITVRGVGGHGAAPQEAKDPILIASEIVVALQTIVSREMSPLLPTVITVGSFHAGTKHNIIPDDAHLQLTVRTMNPEQREKVLAAIARVSNGVAAAAGVPPSLSPVITISPDHVPPTINNPDLARRVATSLKRALGEENVVSAEPVMGSEDFSLFALEDPKPPTVMFRLGAPDPAVFQAAREQGKFPPGLHSSGFAPLPEPTIRTGVKAMTATVLDLMKK